MFFKLVRQNYSMCALCVCTDLLCTHAAQLPAQSTFLAELCINCVIHLQTHCVKYFQKYKYQIIFPNFCLELI